MVDFIGIGAQKAGTSWIYACLYEHPDVCAPQKELHFFSRERYKEGVDWYEQQFSACKDGELRGEFSTSYLYTPGTAARISKHYPDAKLIAVVRNPIDRAFSQYKNAIKAGEISKSTTFGSYVKNVPSAREQGLYAKQLGAYFHYYSSLQLLVMVYEDSKEDPLGYMKTIYNHLEIDPEFVPKMLKQYVNEERTPRFVFVERMMHRVAEGLRKIGLHKLVWAVKRSGATDAVRNANTEEKKGEGVRMTEEERKELATYFKDDVEQLSSLMKRNLNVEWNIH